jgi:quercetin dioxygenase-like cupin family protein
VIAEDEAEAIWFLGTLDTVKASADRTGGALSVVEFTHPPGFATPPHVHRETDEGFYVLEGAMRGSCGDRTWRAGPGSFVWLPRGVPHSYAVEGEETLRSLAITLPAGFERFVAEAGEPARERTLPPPGEPDIGGLDAAAAKVGIEHLGPSER